LKNLFYGLTKHLMNISIEFVLASQSPRRAQLLQQIGIRFTTIPASVDETPDIKYTPEKVAEHLALKKSMSIVTEKPNALVLGADTLVVSRGVIFGKPRDQHEASQMLRKLSGITHIVHTGIALVHHESKRIVTHVESTEVTIGELTDHEILKYVKTCLPMDKAGAYGIQDGLGALLIERINGDYNNVVGLPLRRLYILLSKYFDDLIEF